MKKVFFPLLAILAICSIAATSCSQLAVPPAFDDIMQGGTGNPDVEIILGTEFPVVPGSLPVYRIDQSLFDNKDVSVIAKKLGFNGDPAPLKSGEERAVYSYTNGTQRLEVYPYGRLKLYSSVSLSDIPKNLPSDEECINIARVWLIANDFYPDIITGIKVAVNKTIATVDTETSNSSGDIPLSKNISFFTSIDDFEINLPKASIAIGDGGEVLDASVNFWRFDKNSSFDLKSPKTALEILSRYLSSPEYNPPEAKECMTNWRGFQRLVINSISLRYSIRDNGFMRPFYIFEGVVYSTSYPDGESFVGSVDAIAR